MDCCCTYVYDPPVGQVNYCTAALQYTVMGVGIVSIDRSISEERNHEKNNSNVSPTAVHDTYLAFCILWRQFYC